MRRAARQLQGSEGTEGKATSEARSRRGAGPGSRSGLSWAPPGGTPPSRRRKPGSAPRGSETGSCGRPPPSSAAPAAPWGRGSPRAPRWTAGGGREAAGGRWKPVTRPDGRGLGPGGEERGTRKDSGRQVSQTRSLSDTKSVTREAAGTQPSGRRPAAQAATRATPPARTRAPKAQEQEQAPSREWGRQASAEPPGGRRSALQAGRLGLRLGHGREGERDC